jgi:hypothetical protein
MKKREMKNFFVFVFIVSVLTANCKQSDEDKIKEQLEKKTEVENKKKLEKFLILDKENHFECKKSEECRNAVQDHYCYGVWRNAEVLCKPAIEKVALYRSEWTGDEFYGCRYTSGISEIYAKNFIANEILQSKKDCIENGFCLTGCNKKNIESEKCLLKMTKHFSEFPEARVSTQKITLLGNEIQFQNGFGAWRKMAYYCEYDLMKKTIEVNVYEKY